MLREKAARIRMFQLQLGEAAGTLRHRTAALHRLADGVRKIERSAGESVSKRPHHCAERGCKPERLV